MEPLLEEALTELGPLIPVASARPEKVEAWRGRMPELILTWWQEVGFAGFANGLVWLTDPDEWTDLATDLLRVLPGGLPRSRTDGQRRALLPMAPHRIR